MSNYGAGPKRIRKMPNIFLQEYMRYLYLPVKMRGSPYSDLRLPMPLRGLWSLVDVAEQSARKKRNIKTDYIYLSATRGIATPDNPLNRPGWHCDGFGTGDLNFLFWIGPSTRFLLGWLGEVPQDHLRSMRWFERKEKQIPLFPTPNDPFWVQTYQERTLYQVDPFVVHSTPILEESCPRQYVKVSFSKHKYNLEGNSHNYLFDYCWKMHPRSEIRNDPHKAQRDFV